MNILIVILLGFVAVKQHVHEEALKRVIRTEVKNRYFATENGRLLQIVPLDYTYVSDRKLREWVGKAISETLFLQKEKYKDRLYVATRFFTRSGWNDFTTFLESNNWLSVVDQNNCDVQGRLEVMEIENQGVQASRYFWTIPITVDFGSSSCEIANKMKFQLTLVRSGNAGSPEGIAVEEWKFLSGMEKNDRD